MKTTTRAQTAQSLALYQWTLAGVLAVAVYAISVSPASASLGAICNIAIITQSVYARGLATLGVIAVGIGAMMGKVSWTMAVTIAVGISIIFNAATLTVMMGAPTCDYMS